MELVELYSSKQFEKDSDRGMIKTVVVGKDGIYEEQNSWLGTSLKKVHNYGVIICKSKRTNTYKNSSYCN